MKPEHVKLEIQNSTQEIGVDEIAFAKKLRKKIVKTSQTTLKNGNTQIIIEIDPKIQVD